MQLARYCWSLLMTTVKPAENSSRLEVDEAMAHLETDGCDKLLQIRLCLAELLTTLESSFQQSCMHSSTRYCHANQPEEMRFAMMMMGFLGNGAPPSNGLPQGKEPPPTSI